ncbi:MAG: hypothetical protein OHK0052_10340 [Anaerolineales bacterium]
MIKRVTRIPFFWQTAAALTTAVLLFLFLRATQNLPRTAYPIWQTLGIFFAAALGWLATNWAVRARQDRQKLVQIETLLESNRHKQQALLALSSQMLQAEDESEIITNVLPLARQISAALAVSFVPFDERGHPLSAFSTGELPENTLNLWAEYLASRDVRQKCNFCQQRSAQRPHPCPLLDNPVIEQLPQIHYVHCIPVLLRERQLGILNLYYTETTQPDLEIHNVLLTLADSMALGLERLHLRRRELFTMQQIQNVYVKNDSASVLRSLLENIQHHFAADYAVLMLNNGIKIYLGNLPETVRGLFEGILRSAQETREPLLLGDIAGRGSPLGHGQSWLVAPLLTGENQPALGALLLGCERPAAFHRHQLLLLETLAGQCALIVQNLQLAGEVAYRSIVEERTRLAREIHDGLAQTLGFLKLQAAQMRADLQRGEVERLQKHLDTYYHTLGEAYVEARDAIDGLRILPEAEHASQWLEQMTRDFEQHTGTAVATSDVYMLDFLAPEVQIQLVRIVQEALNNIRKHAQATHVTIACHREPTALQLSIRDDGRGFEPEDVSAVSQYGLRGMRERAELIGADFQIMSRFGQGVTLHLRLPLPVEERL